MVPAPGGHSAAWGLGAAPEYNVKAAYLLLFTRYVTWPPTAHASRESLLVIGVLGRDPFGKVLDLTVEGRSVDGRPIAIRRIPGPEEASACNMVFISRSESIRLPEKLRAMRGGPILTVTEFPGALASGAMVNFIMEANTLRYEVNLAAAEAAGLRITTPMLVSARRILRTAASETEGGR